MEGEAIKREDLKTMLIEKFEVKKTDVSFVDFMMGQSEAKVIFRGVGRLSRKCGQSHVTIVKSSDVDPDLVGSEFQIRIPIRRYKMKGRQNSTNFRDFFF